ncbi:hypothetical protein [Burkholderia vietnamiensis]|uniref:hypothetical protein n=1 Tax=Burkholderia vietnamiensis TaxID=60552 RepID=UPI001CF1D4AE|nr:hypothetical protein [Burkholderia vietnamiensis]MCA8448865.1 hypothetical protein [Burkholderia vietnamiensis]
MSKVFPFPVASKATDEFAVQNDTAVIEESSAKMQRASTVVAPRKVAAHLQPAAEAGETVAWPSPFIPNAFLRFSLFGAQRERMAARSVFSRESRSVKDRYLVADTPHYRIEYDGAEALNSDDLIVLLVCLSVARKHGDMGAYVPISLNECNRYLWKSKSGRNINWFRQSLERLYKGYIKIEVDGVGIKRQRFLANYDDDLRDPNNPVYWIRIDKDMAPLFQADATEIDVVGMAHQQQYLARWLWSFYSTHDGRKDYSVAELQQLSGSSYLPLFKFRAKLRDAMKELTEAKTITNDKGEQRVIPPLFGEGTAITKSDMLHVKKARRSMMIGPAKKDDTSKIEPVKLVEPQRVETERVSAAVHAARAARARVAL